YNRFGWTGTFTLPRVLWLENGELCQAPAEELDRLQHNPQSFTLGTVACEQELAVKNGAQFRLKAEIALNSAKKAGFAVCVGGGSRTEIYYDVNTQQLVFDATANGEEGKRLHRKEAAPFQLADGETLKLDLFVDHSVIEVFANDRQAISRHVYPADPKAALGVTALSDGADFINVRTWEMMASNAY
ncbi:MAG: GH32 C-terminal domain-containing protein, partial [Clostridia bacterium]|nr:GH32 C-terminal domain-containing protein [Clostridia bacterium]